VDEPTSTEQPNELPTDLSGMTDAELEQALADARAESEALDTSTDEGVARLEALADFADAVAVQREANEQAEAERTARTEAAQARLQGGEGDSDTEGDEGDAGADTGTEADAEEGAEGGESTEAVAAGGARRRAPMPRPRRQPTPAAQPARPGVPPPRRLARRGRWLVRPVGDLYGLCADETLDGIGDLPEVGRPPGRHQLHRGPRLRGHLHQSAGFTQTEAEAIAGDHQGLRRGGLPGLR
jgi:hypothetical protein